MNTSIRNQRTATTDTIVLEYSHLKDGESVRGELCPFCNGGRSGEKTFTVTRDGRSLLYNCFRASCSSSGRVRTSGQSGPRRSPRESSREDSKHVFVQRDFDGIAECCLRTLRERFHIDAASAAKHAIQSVEGGSRVVVAVRGWNGESRGTVQRRCAFHAHLSANAVDGPKSLTFTEPDAMAWYHGPRDSKSLVVVEDVFSAIRASEYVNSVALLGTNINDERMKCLKDFAGGTGTIYLCLDSDAFDKAVKFALKYKQSNLKVIKLKKDLKNMTEPELTDWIEDNITHG